MAYYIKGLVRYSQGKLQEAEKEFLSSIKINPLFSGAHFYLGKACLKSGLKEKSGAEMSTSLKLSQGKRKELEIAN